MDTKDMKRMMALFESDAQDNEGPETHRIVVVETRSVYYGFVGTREEAEAFVARCNSGEEDIDDTDDSRVYFDGESDHTDRDDAYVA